MSRSATGPTIRVPANPQLKKNVALKTPKKRARVWGEIGAAARAYDKDRMMTSDFSIKASGVMTEILTQDIEIHIKEMRSSRKVLYQESELRRGYGMQKTLIFLGLLILFAGILWPYLEKIPIGRLPGDIIITRPNLKIYIPIATMIIISIIVSVVLWIFRK